MKNIKLTTTAEEIVNRMLSDISGSTNTNSYGERLSEYYSFVEDDEGNNVSLSATEETDGLSQNEHFYSVHLVDNISGSYCEIFSSHDLSKESLLVLVSELIEDTIKEFE